MYFTSPFYRWSSNATKRIYEAERKTTSSRLGKFIRVRDFVFNLWRERKEALCFATCTDSVFAEILLNRSAEVQAEARKMGSLRLKMNLKKLKLLNHTLVVHCHLYSVSGWF